MSKKILITGFNKNQCTRKFYMRQQLKVVPSHYSLYNCLVDMGYEVEHRMVEIGEDLSKYDDVIVFIAGPRQLVTTTLFNGLWAIAQRPDAVLAYDDWQAPDLFKGVEKCQNEDELFCDFILGVNKKTREELQPFAADFAKAIKVILEKKSRILVSAFQTGHLNDPENYGPQLIFDGLDYAHDRLFVYNPNPYHRNRTPQDPGHEGVEDPDFKPATGGLISLDEDEPAEFVKERRFNFASLVQSRTKKWLKSQGVNVKDLDKEVAKIADWQVDLYGSKADSQKRLTEDEMCLVFAQNWGCLMPGYAHAGSGWWRARPLQVADAGAILIGERKELEVYYGKDFPYLDLRAADIVNATDEELQAIAESQREAIYRIHPLDKKIQQAEIAAVLGAKR